MAALLSRVLLMTRSELIEQLTNRFPQLVAKDAEMAVKVILDAVHEALVNGDRVEVRGFGTFANAYRPPRLGRNPKTGEPVPVGAKQVPHFKAGKELRERIDASRPESVPPPRKGMARRVTPHEPHTYRQTGIATGS